MFAMWAIGKKTECLIKSNLKISATEEIIVSMYIPRMLFLPECSNLILYASKTHKKIIQSICDSMRRKISFIITPIRIVKKLSVFENIKNF